ncbi:hypothetical protein WISP_108343 [Willisornis vidua]|uniref:Uncharacterized protein n=1 Tax=Willisornis vidua TaxID=1566151 RepID=A0ABQ9CXA1_9PASS|nr:hypothetical protein WISP_108343 [Willisornis vidua]
MHQRALVHTLTANLSPPLQDAMPTHCPTIQQRHQSLSRVKLYSTLLGFFMLLQLNWVKFQRKNKIPQKILQKSEKLSDPSKKGSCKEEHPCPIQQDSLARQGDFVQLIDPVSKSFMKMSKSTGPKMEPCEAPLVTGHQSDVTPLTIALCARLVNQLLMHYTVLLSRQGVWFSLSPLPGSTSAIPAQKDKFEIPSLRLLPHMLPRGSYKHLTLLGLGAFAAADTNRAMENQLIVSKTPSDKQCTMKPGGRESRRGEMGTMLLHPVTAAESLDLRMYSLAYSYSQEENRGHITLSEIADVYLNVGEYKLPARCRRKESPIGAARIASSSKAPGGALYTSSSALPTSSLQNPN